MGLLIPTSEHSHDYNTGNQCIITLFFTPDDPSLSLSEMLFTSKLSSAEMEFEDYSFISEVATPENPNVTAATAVFLEEKQLSVTFPTQNILNQWSSNNDTTINGGVYPEPTPILHLGVYCAHGSFIYGRVNGFWSIGFWYAVIRTKWW
jgi:hypothetical protein